MISVMALPLLLSVLMQLTNSLIIQPSILSSKTLKIQRHAVRDFQQFLKTLFPFKLIKFKITPQHPLNYTCSNGVSLAI